MQSKSEQRCDMNRAQSQGQNSKDSVIRDVNYILSLNLQRVAFPKHAEKLSYCTLKIKCDKFFIYKISTPHPPPPTKEKRSKRQLILFIWHK